MTRQLAAALLLATISACASEPTLTTRPGFRGRVVLSVTLQGNGLETNGFTWVVGQTRSGRVVPGRPLTVSDIAEGTQTVRLVEIPPHCSVRESAKTVTISDGATASVDFIAECFGGFAYTGRNSSQDQQIFYLSEDGSIRKLTQLTGRSLAHEFPRTGRDCFSRTRRTATSICTPCALTARTTDGSRRIRMPTCYRDGIRTEQGFCSPAAHQEARKAPCMS